MVKIVVLILESGSVLEMLLLISAGGENTLHFLYLFQKTKIFSPPIDLLHWCSSFVVSSFCLSSNLSYQC